MRGTEYKGGSGWGRRRTLAYDAPKGGSSCAVSGARWENHQPSGGRHDAPFRRSERASWGKGGTRPEIGYKQQTTDGHAGGEWNVSVHEKTEKAD